MVCPIGCSSTHLLLKLLLIYGSGLRLFFSQASTRRARQPPLGQSFSPVSFHAAVCCQCQGSYIVPGATLLGTVLIWYTVNRLLQQTLLHKPLPFFGFVFVFLSNMFTVGSSTSATLVLPVYIHTYMYMHIIYIIIYMCVYDYIYTCICIHAWLDHKLHRCRMLDVCLCNLNYPRYHEKEVLVNQWHLSQVRLDSILTVKSF